MPQTQPKVTVLDHTAHPLNAVFYAARTCYSSDSPVTLWKKKVPKAQMQELLLRTLEAGHHSVLEHAVFVFAISGISRACSHQLVRHRIASFSQQSQRYVKASEPSYVVPPSIARNSDLAGEYKRIITGLYEKYDQFIKAGIPREDARFLLPNASSTHLIMTLNLRELIHISSIRLCTNAQWEIRNLFMELQRAVRAIDPFLSSLLKPKCDSLGYCPEFRSCGRYPMKKDVIVPKTKNRK